MKLTIQQQLIKKLSKEFAETEIRPLARQIDETDEFPQDLFCKMAEAGFFGLKLPKEYGGSNADSVSYVLAEEQVSRGSGVAGVYLSSPNSLSSMPLLLSGSREQKSMLLPGLVRGEYFICFALTEPNAGSDVSAISTEAIKVNGGYLLRGRKCFITGAGFAKYGIVMAKTKPDQGIKGLSAFIVDLESEGVKRGRGEKKMGLRGCSTGDLVFDGAFVPDNCLLGKEGGGYEIAMNSLNIGRLGVAAQALGIAQAAFEEAVSFSKTRVQFGKSIGKFQAIGFMLAEMKTRIAAARALTYEAAELLDNGKDATELTAMSKYYAAETAVEVANQALQIHGGYGYINGYPIERIYRDARVLTIYEGTSQIQKIVISKYVGT